MQPIRDRAAGESGRYFAPVREAIEHVRLTPIVGRSVAPAVLGIGGESDPYEPSALYRSLRAGGGRMRIRTIPGARHGSCFVHPGFRDAAVALVAQGGD